MKLEGESVVNNAFDWQSLWSYLVGTNEPPKDELEHTQLEHRHLDRRSGLWVAHEEAREKAAA
jgi:hypothetical protein